MDTKRLVISAAIALATSTSHAATTSNVVCSYAPSQSAVVNRITSGLGGAAIGAEAMLKAVGLTVVQHSSASYIFTGSGGYVAGTCGGAIVAPVLYTVAIVVAGTAITLELSCAPKNYPETVKRVKEIIAEFNKSVRSVNGKAVDLRDGTAKKIIELNDKAIDVRDATAEAVRVANYKAIEFRDSARKRIAIEQLFGD